MTAHYRKVTAAINNSLAFIGLSDKFISPKTYIRNGENKYTLNETGKAVFVTDKKVKEIKVGNKAVEFAENNGLYEFSASDKEIEIILGE